MKKQGFQVVLRKGIVNTRGPTRNYPRPKNEKQRNGQSMPLVRIFNEYKIDTWNTMLT
jgi:hypothetical protein